MPETLTFGTPDSLKSPNFVSGFGSVGMDNQELDLSARLIDPSAEVWGLTCASTSQTESMIQKSLGTGYLLQRRGYYGGIHLLGVRLLYNGSDSPHTCVLKDILIKYRSMISLAKARGLLIDEMLPWHLSVARTAQSGLTSLLRWKR